MRVDRAEQLLFAMSHGPDRFDLCGEVLLHMLRDGHALLRLRFVDLGSTRESYSAVERLRMRLHGDELNCRPTEFLQPSRRTSDTGDRTGDASGNDPRAEQDHEAVTIRTVCMAG
jgi:hypothetical protein